jgi:hypothetical protein
MRFEFPNKIDQIAAQVGVLLYLACAVFLLPPSEYFHAVGGGLLVFSAVVALSQFKGRGWLPGGSVLVVGFAATAILVMPTLPAMGGTERRAIPIGFLGVQATILLWACMQWPYLRRPKDHVSLATALKYGFLFAAGLSVVASLPILLTLMSDAPSPRAILLTYPAYFAGFVSAAIIYWSLQRIAHLAFGRYLIGILGGMCVYGAVGPVVFLFQNEKIDIPMLVAIAAIAGGFVGPALALNATERASTRAAQRFRL